MRGRRRPETAPEAPATSLTDIAVGARSVWLADPFDGLVWRIAVTPRVVMRTIDVGVGVDRIAFGEGSLWATNSLRGTLVRIDPSTNDPGAPVSVGNTPRNIAIGEGAVWVSVAGAPGQTVPPASDTEFEGLHALPRSSCGRVFYGGTERPDYLIASELPLQGGEAFPALQMSEAIAYMLRQRHFRAGRFRIAYQSCDDSTPKRVLDLNKCIANAKEYARNRDVLGIIGPYNSGCAFEQLPVLNRSRGRPLAMVSPSTSVEELTRRGPTAPPDLLPKLYPTGKRNYFRVISTERAHAAANAVLAQQLGLASVFVLHDGDPVFGVPKAIYFRGAAARAGVAIAGFGRWDQGARRYADLAKEVARSRAEGVFLAGGLYSNGGAVIRDLRARLGPRVPIMAPDFFSTAELFEKAGPAARGVYVSTVGLTSDRLPPEGRRFMRGFAGTQPGRVDRKAAYAAQATEVLLDAIARSDGTRQSVVRELHALQVRDGILGDFEFTPTGDTTSTPITIFRAQRGGGAKVIEGRDGSVIDRVIEPPPRLFR